MSDFKYVRFSKLHYDSNPRVRPPGQLNGRLISIPVLRGYHYSASSKHTQRFAFRDCNFEKRRRQFHYTGDVVSLPVPGRGQPRRGRAGPTWRQRIQPGTTHHPDPGRVLRLLSFVAPPTLHTPLHQRELTAVSRRNERSPITRGGVRRCRHFPGSRKENAEGGLNWHHPTLPPPSSTRLGSGFQRCPALTENAQERSLRRVD